jgi:hypothetical protein
VSSPARWRTRWMPATLGTSRTPLRRRHHQRRRYPYPVRRGQGRRRRAIRVPICRGWWWEAPAAIREAQAISLARGVPISPLVIGLPGDPEEKASVGDGPELPGLPKPVQSLPNALFPDNGRHGLPRSWFGGSVGVRPLFYHGRECPMYDNCTMTPGLLLTGIPLLGRRDWRAR